ncbi:MAG: flagellar hook-basal body complex protein FliE [Chromatiaceae bacterium]|jgi:flagellar hook-basal body complex protein FliE
MSTPEINQVLAQMRLVKAQAIDGVGHAVQQAPETGFGDLLKRSIDAVNATQQDANAMRTAFEQGDQNLDLAEVMIAMQKSSVSFQAMVEVRNKLVEAYKDIKNMPV